MFIICVYVESDCVVQLYGPQFFLFCYVTSPYDVKGYLSE